MADQIAKFLVVFRPPQRQQQMYKVEVNTLQYTFAANAAALAIKVLQTSKAKQAMTQLALALAGGGTPMRIPIRNNPGLARRVVYFFAGRISQRFPGIVIDASIDAVETLGFHVGIPWGGSPKQFDPRRQMVHINARVCKSSTTLYLSFVPLSGT
jgi:hypothetical protein